MTDLARLLQEGKTAFEQGLDSSENPYPVGTAAYWNWLEGWEYAERQSQDESEFWHWKA